MIRELAHSIFALVVLACIIVGAAFLTGCSEAKFVECLARDNSRNPCN